MASETLSRTLRKFFASPELARALEPTRRAATEGRRALDQLIHDFRDGDPWSEARFRALVERDIGVPYEKFMAGMDFMDSQALLVNYADRVSPRRRAKSKVPDGLAARRQSESKRLMVAAGISGLTDFELKSGVTQRAIRDWWNCKTAKFRDDIEARVCKTLRISASQLPE